MKNFIENTKTNILIKILIAVVGGVFISYLLLDFILLIGGIPLLPKELLLTFLLVIGSLLIIVGIVKILTRNTPKS